MDAMDVEFHSREMYASTGADAHTRTRHYQAWLTIDGKAVCHIALLEAQRFGGLLYIKSIETREGYQRLGLATRLIKESAFHFKRGLGSLGFYTPEGFAALRGKVRYVAGVETPEEPAIESQTFVKDWDSKYGPIT